MGAFMACLTCAKAGRLDVRDIDLNRLAGHLGRDWGFIDRRWPNPVRHLRRERRRGQDHGTSDVPSARLLVLSAIDATLLASRLWAHRRRS